MIHDALVIGAGPAGSTAARLLAQAGWSVALVKVRAFRARGEMRKILAKMARDKYL